MLLPVVQLVSITLAALVFGVFWGPWIGLTRSMTMFPGDVFLAIVHRMDRNLGPLMTVLFPITLASMVAVLALSFGGHPLEFWLTTIAVFLFLVALIVTLRVEVPIVARVRSWTRGTMPADWQQQRDRWVSFHLLRVLPGLVGLVLLTAGAIF